MSQRIVVIGGGPGGTEVAMRTARAGHRVTIIERDRCGGTCTNRGCIPTKFLLAAVVQERQKSGRVDGDAWRKIQARKKALTEGLSRKIERDMTAAGVTVIKGRGELAGRREVTVIDDAGKVGALGADVIVLATGSTAPRPPTLGLDGRRIISSDEVLELQEIPESIIIIGGGFIGTEFGRLFSLLGTRVFLLEALPHILPSEDDDTAEVVSREFERQGVTLITGVGVAGATAGEQGVRVALSDGRSLESTLALVSVGRGPAGAELGLERVGIRCDARGAVEVNLHLETGTPGIYAVGDLTGNTMLAHVATAQGMTVAERISGDSRAMEYRAIPYAVFVSPEVATVGLTELAARKLGMKYAVGKAAWSGNLKARIDLDQYGFVKVLADPATGLLLGGTIVGPRAAELIHALTVAIQADLTADEFAHGVFVHPTLSESFREAAEHLV